MDGAPHNGRFDWLVELAGATALALAAAYSALKAAPSLLLPGPAAMAASGFAFFGLGMVTMRSVKPSRREHPLPDLPVACIEPGELLLDTRFEEPLLLEDVLEDEALLLEDRLADAPADSRVVRLFTVSGEAGGSRGPAGAQVQADASKALYAALNELRRSLR